MNSDALFAFALEQKKNYPNNYFTKIYFASLPIHPDKFRYICQGEVLLGKLYFYFAFEL